MTTDTEPRRRAEALQETLNALSAECERRNLYGADGEAILYLGAIFALADGVAATPAESDRPLACGLDQ